MLKDVSNKHQIILGKVVRGDTVFRKEFMNLVNNELNKVWKDGKKKKEYKAYELEKKHVKEEAVPEMHLGVCIGDKKLNDIEVELNKETVDNDNDKPAIYAGIEGITPVQEEILMSAPNHRIFPKLNLEIFETELEKCMIKAKWEKTREERNNEQHFKAIETGEHKDTSTMGQIGG
jgi:hypothetical protein